MSLISDIRRISLAVIYLHMYTVFSKFYLLHLWKCKTDFLKKKHLSILWGIFMHRAPKSSQNYNIKMQFTKQCDTKALTPDISLWAYGELTNTFFQLEWDLELSCSSGGRKTGWKFYLSSNVWKTTFRINMQIFSIRVCECLGYMKVKCLKVRDIPLKIQI